MTAEEELFDIIIPPGVPRKLIIDISKKFKKIKVVERIEPLHFANMDGDKRELLAFRGPMDELKKVEKYMIAQLKEFVGEK
jgi:hypothetical protein